MSRLAAAWATYQDRLLRRCPPCGEWAWDQDDCAVCGAPATSTAGVVREHHHQISREHRHLLDVADATCRAHDDENRESA